MTCGLPSSRLHRFTINITLAAVLCLTCVMTGSGQTIRIPLLSGLKEFTKQSKPLKPRPAAPLPGEAETALLIEQTGQQPAISSGAADTDSGHDDKNSDPGKKPEDRPRVAEIVPVIVAPEPLIVPPPDADAAPPSTESDHFQWQKAYRQSLMFLGIQHGFRLLTEPSTRADLKGPFFSDWFTSVSRLRGWRDGDPFLVNYIGHPMQGAVTGYIQVHNDPRGYRQEIGRDKAYWKSRFKAFAWSAVYSVQFELGPFSESSIGNVGLKPSDKSPHPQAWVDLVVTPVLGTAWMVGEDALDRWVVRPLERHTTKYPVKILIRGFLNPSRSFANLLRGKWPWYRDDR